METLGTAQIRKLNQFARLSSADKQMLVRMSGQHIRRFKARDDIIREGEKPEMINLIQQGWACRYKVLEDGRRQIIAFFLPGDLCDLNIFTLRENLYPLRLQITVGAAPAHTVQAWPGDGWVRFALPTTPGPAPVTVELTDLTPPPPFRRGVPGERRHILCFAAEARR